MATLTAAKKRLRPGPRPRGPFQDKRKTLTTRITERTRKGLEEAAAAEDRSLSQEIEFRLEESFRRDREFGGRELRGLFHMMTGAAEIIEDRTGKTFSEDVETFMAMKKAWDRLLSSYAPDFEVYQKYLESIGFTRLESEFKRLESELPSLPTPPTPPEYPESFRKGLLDGASSPEQADYDKRWAAYQKKIERVRTKVNKWGRRFEEVQQHFREIDELGKNVALDLLPPKPRD